MKHTIRNLFFISILLIGFTTKIQAHPHVFLENKIRIIFDKQGLVGVQATWLFDEIFSESIRMDYDRNRDHFFDDTECATIESEAFSNLENFDYFFHITLNDSIYTIVRAIDFQPYLWENQLEYRFTIPCRIIEPGTYSLHIRCYDPTYFIAVDTKPKGSVSVYNTGTLKTTAKITKDCFTTKLYGELETYGVHVEFKIPTPTS